MCAGIAAYVRRAKGAHRPSSEPHGDTRLCKVQTFIAIGFPESQRSGTRSPLRLQTSARIGLKLSYEPRSKAASGTFGGGDDVDNDRVGERHPRLLTPSRCWTSRRALLAASSHGPACFPPRLEADLCAQRWQLDALEGVLQPEQGRSGAASKRAEVGQHGRSSRCSFRR